MAIYASLSKAYAQAVYLDGTKKFADIRAEYVEPVKAHAAANYTDEQIINAKDKGFISQTEFDQTMAIKYPGGYTQPVESLQAPIAQAAAAETPAKE